MVAMASHYPFRSTMIPAMLLDGRNAVIYGAAGSIGGAVARAFAAEGATVHSADARYSALRAGRITARGFAFCAPLSEND